MEFGRIFLGVLSIVFILGPLQLVLSTVRSVLAVLARKEVLSVWGRVVSLKDDVDSDGSKSPSIQYEFSMKA